MLETRRAAFPKNATRLFDRKVIDAALDTLANGITEQLSDKTPVVLPVLHGGLIMSGHLLTRLHFPLHQDYIHATRYRGATEGSNLQWIAKPLTDLKDRTVLLLDDIFDQGFTLAAINQWCLQQGAAAVQSAVLITKKHQRDVADYRPDYSALSVNDRYVFGFGMDYQHRWRNADGIYAINN